METVAAIFFAFWAIIQVSAAPTADPAIDTNVPPVVDTKYMEIHGRWNVSYAGRNYKIFEGIPYAEPLVAERRFEPPQPILTRRKAPVFATKEPLHCVQYDYKTRLVDGTEDCLFGNIYVPQLNKKDAPPLPVIIWIHEGNFQRGAGTYTKARYIMDRDVILATFNYRLGAHGFLSTEDDVVPGNMGLKDQNLFIKWVVDNIASFGGDPKQISLFGADAGGSSVHYHYLSKMSAGLFKNGVSFSGTALSPWAFDPQPLVIAKRLAGLLDCPIDKGSKTMVECLKKVPARVLAGRSQYMLDEDTAVLYKYPLFMPVAEKSVGDYFISKSPEEILKSGQIYGVPWTSGVVSEEGAATMCIVASVPQALKLTDKYWELLNPYFLMYNHTSLVTKKAQIGREARQHYLGNLKPFVEGDKKTIKDLLYMQTHEAFHTVLEKSVRLHAKTSKAPVYTYYYSYRGAMSETTSISPSKENFGVSNLDDIFLVLENDYINPTTTPRDKEMLNIMLDFWVKAATTGKPSMPEHELPQVDPGNSKFQYLEIAGPNKYTLRSIDDFAQKKFWNGLGFNLIV